MTSDSDLRHLCPRHRPCPVLRQQGALLRRLTGQWLAQDLAQGLANASSGDIPKPG